MAALVLDSEGLAKWALGDGAVRAQLRAASRLGWPIVVPPTTLAEVIRGGADDAAVHRLLPGAWQTFIGPTLARQAGSLLARSGLRGATADAFVVAEARRHGVALILTADTRDFQALAAGDPRIEIIAV
ncbi:MAG: PIN domain-containing protein [Candidatus Dormibacteraeota bacterium]|nr:PIN domain-containing protein [Candidatus Dormibacteraeota bacterium]